jgi:hypothetical protein
MHGATVHRVFLLSPARLDGRRAGLLFNPRTGFALAQSLQRGEARSIGEIFSFLSGLYFRGKLAYAAVFAQPPEGAHGSLVITSARGLVSAESPVTLADLRRHSKVPIDPLEMRYRRPLLKAARDLAQQRDCEFVRLGSISTDKYVGPLLEVFGDRLLFPIEFVGRGDMSRGGLLLRCVRDGQELTYQPVAGAMRRGTRPAKLTPTTWRGTPWAPKPPE